MIAKVSPHHQITMVDVNKRALNLAKRIKANQIDNVIIKESDGLSQLKDSHFDYVLTNPPIRAAKKLFIVFLKKHINS